MLKRLILRLLPIAFVAPLILGHQASAQEIDFIVQLSCPSYGTAEMSFQNHSDRTLRSTAFVRTPSGSTNAGAIIAEPYDSDTLTMSPSIMPENGWSIIVEDMTGSAGSLYSETYTAGFCSANGTPPTMTPPTPTPTQALVPTATLAPEQTPIPVPNSFTLISAQRMCADQSFVATWSGANVTVVEFSITNTSDEWTSGWVAGDPASSSFTMTVDHHSYDKAAARSTFEDGNTTEAFMDIGACTEAPAPPPPPAVVDPPAAAPVVSSLPSTGSGDDGRSMLVFGALALLASSSIVLSTLRKRI